MILLVKFNSESNALMISLLQLKLLGSRLINLHILAQMHQETIFLLELTLHQLHLDMMKMLPI